MEIGFRDLQRMTVKLLDEKLNGSKMVIKVDGEPKYVLSGVDSQADTITGFRIGKKSLPPAFEDYYREKAKAQHLDLEDYLIKQFREISLDKFLNLFVFLGRINYKPFNILGQQVTDTSEHKVQVAVKK